MPKESMSDVVKVTRRPPPRMTLSRVPSASRPPSSLSPIWWKASAVALALLLAAGVLTMNAHATVTVVPRHMALALNHTLPVPVESMTLDEKDVRTVPATGVEHVDRKASGTIVVYNNYSAKAQKLISQTRFRSPDGKIYRLTSGVTVPGWRRVGTSMVPGSVEVQVVADASGASSNIGLTDFAIPGFEGTPRFTKFYGRSKTEMTGGFSGDVKTAKQEDIASAHASLETSLQAKLLREANAQVPDGYLLVPTPDTVQFHDLPPSAGTSTSYVVSLDGAFEGKIIKKDLLAQAVAKALVSDYDGAPVQLLHPESLAIVPHSFDISVTGTTTLVWTVDAQALAAQLAGTPASQFQSVFKNFPTVDRAEPALTPFWVSSFPKDPSRITVVMSVDNQ